MVGLNGFTEFRSLGASLRDACDKDKMKNSEEFLARLDSEFDRVFGAPDPAAESQLSLPS